MTVKQPRRIYERDGQHFAIVSSVLAGPRKYDSNEGANYCYPVYFKAIKASSPKRRKKTKPAAAT